MGLFKNIRCKLVGHQWRTKINYELENTSEGRVLFIKNKDVCSCGQTRTVLSIGRFLDKDWWAKERTDPFYSFEVSNGKEAEALVSMDLETIRAFAERFANDPSIRLDDLHKVTKKLK